MSSSASKEACSSRGSSAKKQKRSKGSAVDEEVLEMLHKIEGEKVEDEHDMFGAVVAASIRSLPCVKAQAVTTVLEDLRMSYLDPQ